MEEGALQIPDYHIGNPEMFDINGAVHLTTLQREDLKKLLDLHVKQRASKLGHARSAEHRIDTKDAVPVHLYSSRVSKALEEKQNF